MDNGTAVFLCTAATLGFVHTVVGPDHYLPFIVMAKAGRWSAAKTAVVTFLCGLGHIGSSVVLGAVGVACGLAVRHLTGIESVRGEIAAWLLIAFGLTYFVWGMHRAIRGRTHTHSHIHADGELHDHTHGHLSEHTHVHTAGERPSMTPWILSTVFVFGPCEPLIPILMYPAARSSGWTVALVAGVFGAATILTMMAIVMATALGLAKLPVGRLERYSHAMAGLVIFACGGAIRWLGL